MRHGEHKQEVDLESMTKDEILIHAGLSASLSDWREAFPCNCHAVCECFDEEGNYVAR